MILNPNSFSAAAALLSVGLSVYEATAAHAIGGLVLLVGLVASAWPGVKYGIPFPVFARASFGYHGAQFCTITRGLVAIMWLSFQLWNGALGLVTGIDVAAPGFAGWGRISSNLTGSQLLMFIGFAGLHMLVICSGPERFRPLVGVSAFALLAGLIGLMVWASGLAPFEDVFSSSISGAVTVQMPKALQWLVGINSAMSSWSTLLLNVCDLSRFTQTQTAQIVGQSIGFPLPYAWTGFVGAWIAGATYLSTGKALWLVPTYFELMPPWAAILGAIVLALSILIVNVMANMLSPINDLLNLAPLIELRAPNFARLMTFRSCATATLVAALFVCPWATFSSASDFILGFLGGYAMLTGAIAGVMMIDFWIIKGGELDVAALYVIPGTSASDSQSDSEAQQQPKVHPAKGIEAWNWRAFAAVAVAVAPLLPGFLDELTGRHLSSVWTDLYRVSLIASFLIGAGVYYGCEVASPRVKN